MVETATCMQLSSLWCSDADSAIYYPPAHARLPHQMPPVNGGGKRGDSGQECDAPGTSEKKREKVILYERPAMVLANFEDGARYSVVVFSIALFSGET